MFENIFSIPLYVEKLDIDVGRLVDLSYDLKNKDPGVNLSNLGGWQSNALHSENRDFLNLIDACKHHVQIFSEKILINTKNNLKFRQFWININGYKDSNLPHIHLQSVLSGVIYLQCNEKSGNIRFYHPSQTFPCLWNNVLLKEFNQYNSSIYERMPEPGDFLLFPSWLEHSVLPNLSMQDRISISFDIS